jgi:sec-independent protein translocase protein TatA
MKSSLFRVYSSLIIQHSSFRMYHSGFPMHPLFGLLDINPVTLVIIGIIAVMLYGENLPEAARKAGKYLTDFKRGMKSIQDEIRSAALDPPSSTSPRTSSASSVQDEAAENHEEPTAPKFEPPAE